MKSRHFLRRAPAPRDQAGQALPEYVVVCAALALALFVPVGGDPAAPGGSRSAVEIVLDGFAQAYRNISHAISLPNP